MSPRSRRNLVLVILLLLALLALLFFARCSKTAPLAVKAAAVSVEPLPVKTSEPAPKAIPVEEVLTPATVTVPERVEAGATFRATWTGPDNRGDYLTITRPTAAPSVYENYQETRHGPTLELTAPMEAGDWEVRYVTTASKTILGKAPLVVSPVAATLTAPDEVMLGTPVTITWAGPNRTGDFITIVRHDAGDAQVGNYTDAIKGSPLQIEAPVEIGDFEIRYVSGQGRKVLGRRSIKVLQPQTSLASAESVVAGKVFAVTWQGPKNAGDYITVVPKGTPDGQYRNYTDTSKGSPLDLTAPIEAGDAEIRYMTGTQARVLARRPIKVLAPTVTLAAVDEAIAGSVVTVDWTGPNNAGDYLTIVSAATPAGQYGNYTDAAKGSPLKVTAPIRPGASEIRYMSGQGAKVLGRRAIAIIPAQITLSTPNEASVGTTISIEWTGPNNAGDYLTIVPKTTKDGSAGRMINTSRGSPVKIELPKETGEFELRYMSGQGGVVLARASIALR
jgi:CxxC motif-containing protein